jgi:hypothetical protein
MGDDCASLSPVIPHPPHHLHHIHPTIIASPWGYFATAVVLAASSLEKKLKNQKKSYCIFATAVALAASSLEKKN